MKRIFTVILCTLALLVMTSCSTPEARVEKYVKENRLLDLDAGYVYCDTELEARGTNVVYKIVIENEIDEGFTREIIKEYHAMLDGEFKEFYEMMKDEEPAITSLILEFCDYDGNVLANYTYK